MSRLTSKREEGGQALAIVVAVLALLVLLPTAVQALATGQAPSSTNALLQQQALQAARAGLSDYINHVITESNYLNYCSTGVSAFGCQSGQSVDTNNPGFDTSSFNTWATVQNASSIDKEGFSYLVNTSTASSDCASGSLSPTVYVTGRAGSSSAHYVYQELEVTLSVTLASWGCDTPISSQSYSSCSGSNGYSVTVPSGATYAEINIYGAQGGGLSNARGGGGDGYSITTAYAEAYSGETWDVTVGEGGSGAQFEILGIGYAVPGRSCLGTMNLGGGDPGGGVVSLLSENGGAGAGATGICVDGSSSSQCASGSSACSGWNGTTWATSGTPCVLAVAGGGGGDGGDSGGTGGYYDSSGNGQSGSGSGGSLGGNNSTQGGTGGGSLLSVLCGAGGGGGGGFTKGGSGGSEGGLNLLGLLCLGGSGGGGGAGKSDPPPTPTGCSAPTTGAVSSYPVPGAPSGSVNGYASITFYSGTACTGSSMNVASISPLDIQPVPTGTT